MNGKQLKNSILQWAIQGKLVPQDPNDEPASVLLEKIRQEKERLIKEKKIKRDKNASIIYRGEDNSYYASNPQPIGFRGNLLVKRQKFFYCTYSLGITETS